jgi:lysyl-tRNA synthetase class 2
MLTVGAGLVAAAAYLFFRPVVARRRSAGADTGLERAREIVKKHGSGTLDYFALRSDKQFFFWGDTVIAYGVYGGVCLVSPDPIGPVAERDEAWRAFRRFADDQGWTLAVLGAGEEWLPVYRESGMHDLYVGDEAVVDCGRFTLEGGRYKGLRQAVNRMAKYGYRVSFHDPALLDPALRSQLESVMTKSRRGDVERGFSMTLGRAFDPADAGLLLAVVHGPADGSPDGQPGPVVAFIQYVPAPGIDGYSLDLMRRDDGDHPNGLMDFAIVETIKQLPALGRYGLGLNFATMRAVLAGEAGEGLSQRIQAWMLRRMSGSMQIESLWRFNAKYDPRWQPRYAIYDSTEHALPAAMAIARAESFWELPVIGRLLVPGSDRTEPTPEPAASTTA